jgi:hypothetical protein
LKQKLLQLGKKCIGYDGAYNGHLDVASYPNHHDSCSVKNSNQEPSNDMKVSME